MIFLEVMTAIFAIILAWLQKIPVRKMRDHGASIAEEKEFHEASGYIKVLWAFPYVFIYSLTNVIGGVLTYFLLSLIIWLVFDLALNKFTGKELFYVGNTAQLDKLQRKYLGRYAGQIKAAVCLLLIVGLNILYYKVLL